jgi:hypothetical protein
MNPCKEAPMPATEPDGLHRHGAEVGHRQAEARHRRGLKHDEGPQLLQLEGGEQDVQGRHGDERQQRRVRNEAHTQTLDESRIRERGHPHEHRTQRKH